MYVSPRCLLGNISRSSQEESQRQKISKRGEEKVRPHDPDSEAHTREQLGLPVLQGLPLCMHEAPDGRHLGDGSQTGASEACRGSKHSHDTRAELQIIQRVARHPLGTGDERHDGGLHLDAGKSEGRGDEIRSTYGERPHQEDCSRSGFVAPEYRGLD